MNSTKTRKLRRELGVSKPGRKQGQKAKAAVTREPTQDENQISPNKFLGQQNVPFGEQIATRLAEAREKREANRATLAAQNAAKVEDDGDTLPITPTNAEETPRERKNRKVREARAAKKAAQS